MPIARLNAFNSAFACILISAFFSFWLYWVSDFKTEQLLTSREWQSQIITLVKSDAVLTGQAEHLRHVDINSNVKYLPNNTYIRVSVIKVYNQDNHADTNIEISERGDWTMSDGYLLISPTEFKDISANQSRDFTQEQLDIVTQFFRMDAQQSRRIDIVKQNTLLLTSLNHDSVTLYAHDLP